MTSLRGNLVFVLALAAAAAACDAPVRSLPDTTLSGVTPFPVRLPQAWGDLAMCPPGRTRMRCYARAVIDETGAMMVSPHATPAGLGATDLQAAYALDPTIDPHATIAITDAFSYAGAESDLAMYRQQFGLPPCTVANGCLKIVNQLGQTSPLPKPSPPGDDWTVETALDLDMASAGCPKCKLLLVQA